VSPHVYVLISLLVFVVTGAVAMFMVRKLSYIPLDERVSLGPGPGLKVKRVYEN